MVQGTSSHVGKSVLCTALCRIFRQDGWRVAPFKAQNMALNSYVTVDGKEIGRAQGVQAEAAGVQATADMNPILLKPKKDMVAQVIVRGRPLKDMSATECADEYVFMALQVAAESLSRLGRDYDVIVIEGAGSPAEVNLKHRDVANMRIAELANAPVLLAADIDRGGVFASLLGTLELLEPHERDRVAGFIINKFRGDLGLLRPGLEFLERRTGKPVLGVIPYLPSVGIAEEDSVALTRPVVKSGDGRAEIEIAVIQLPRISNFTDFDPFLSDPGVAVRYVREEREIGWPDAVIIPGTKNTVEDLVYLRETGLAQRIVRIACQGIPVLGICGGYQILGQKIYDPYRAEADLQEVDGLGLLPVVTTFEPDKITVQVRARVISQQGLFASLTGEVVEGYEIHMGRTILLEGAEPIFAVEGRCGPAEHGLDGATVPGGRVFGTYLHGLFANDRFRRRWLNSLRIEKGLPPVPEELEISFSERQELAYDNLAAVVRSNLDMEALYNIIGLKPRC